MPHPCSKLTILETIWVMVRDSTVAAPAPACCLPHQILSSPSHKILADGLCQHGCRQVHDNQLAGKDRHHSGHEPGGLPASISSRLTESTVRSKNRI